jgi:hypothetical protein
MPIRQVRRLRALRHAEGDGLYEAYVSLTTRAAMAGWRVRVGIAQLVPVWAPGTELHGRLALTFRATLLRDEQPVAEARGHDMTLDTLPSIVWRDPDACVDFVFCSREWWPDVRENDATIAGHVVRELVAERAVEIGAVYADAPVGL